MFLRRCYQALVLGTIGAVILTACGSAASPTAAPAPAQATPVPTKAGTAPTPAVTAPAANQSSAPIPTGTGYPPEKIKELLAQNMYLSGMSFGAGETPQYGGTASYSNKAPLQGGDPYFSSITSINVLGMIKGDGNLVKEKRGNNFEFEGFLAQSWTMSDDAKTWTFNIRPGVLWHDGHPYTAEDAKFWLDMAVFPPKGRIQNLANSVPGLKETVVVDQMTVKLVFKDPSPYLPETFFSLGSSMGLPKHLAQPILEKGNVNVDMTDLNWTSVGPFKFDHYERGSSFRAVRFDKYFEKDAQGRALPFLDAALNVFIPDRTVAIGAFRAGRLDSTPRGVGSSLDPGLYASVERTLPGKAWYHRYPYNEYGISMNIFHPPFTDVRVRQAVNLYMDREEGALKMQGGYAFSTNFFGPGNWYHSGAYKDWPGFRQSTKAADQAEAKRLIKEAGVAGAKVEILCRIDYLFMCEFMDPVLRQVGFEPYIELLDVNTQSDRSRTLQYDTAPSGPGAVAFPGEQLAGYVTTAITNRFNDPKIDQWQSVVLNSKDPLVRRQALWDAEKYMILEKAYMAPFLREETVQAYRTYLKGSWVPGYEPHKNTDRATDWIDKSMR